MNPSWARFSIQTLKERAERIACLRKGGEYP